MNQKCYLCDRADAQIIERPDGYDGKLVMCPSCTHYEIDRNAEIKINHGHRIPDTLINKVRSHFNKTGKPYRVGTIDLDIG